MSVLWINKEWKMGFTKEEREAVYEQSIEYYGFDHQVDLAIEEMSELTKALLKSRRFRSCDGDDLFAIIDEIADVKIMIRQLEMIFGCVEQVSDRIDFKVKRQLERMGLKDGKEEREMV